VSLPALMDGASCHVELNDHVCMVPGV